MKKILDRWGNHISLTKKLWLIMRLSSLLILVAVFSSKASVYSQTTKISLKMENVKIAKVFDAIEQQSEFYFFYNRDFFNDSRKVSVDFKNQKIDEILTQLFEGHEIEYEILDRNILIKVPDILPGIAQELQQQQRSISGIVTDTDGEPMPGVTVIIQGTNAGTVTNTDGKFSLSVPSDAEMLQFSFVGFRTQEIPLEGKTTFIVTMEEETVGIEEVVVIGYGVKKKVNLTSAVKMVDTKDLENRPVKSVTEMLTGSVPNLNIEQVQGSPDWEPRLNIRGFTGINETGEPLVLVDGTESDISLVNSEDVESISILKDAAASAIYGSRAPDGVILIETKSGKKGKEYMNINVNSSVQLTVADGLPEMLDALEFVNFGNKRSRNSLKSPFFPEETIEAIRQYMNGEIDTKNVILNNGKYGNQPWLYNANSDHYDNAFADFVLRQKYNLSIIGGSKKTGYYASVGYIDHPGIMESDVDWMKRVLTNLKVNTDVTDWLSFGAIAKYNRQTDNRPMFRGKPSGVSDPKFMNHLTGFPQIPDVNDNGEYNPRSEIPSIKGLTGVMDRTKDEIFSRLNMELKPFKGFSIKGDYTWLKMQQNTFKPTLDYYVADADGSLKRSRGSSNKSSIERETSWNQAHNVNVLVTYSTLIGKNDISMLAGYNQELHRSTGFSVYNTYLYTNSVPSLNTTYGENINFGESINSWATRGYFFRASYNYNGIYLLDFNSRYDATSKYSPETRWAFFPSVSAGYNVAKEKFWPLKEKISMFKIKGSYGRLGNPGGANYSYIATMNTSPPNKTNIFLENSSPAYVNPPNIISDALTWTKPAVLGFGLETRSLQNRLAIEYDWYQRTVYDQQGPAAQYPVVLGTNPPKSNNSVSETRGWELSIDWRDKAFRLAGAPLNYGVRAGLSDYVGYVVEYDENETGKKKKTWTPGEVFGQMRVYEGAIAQNADYYMNNMVQYGSQKKNWFYPGDLVFKDTNGDGKIDGGEGGYWYSEGDSYVAGYSYPRYKYHLRLDAGWKGLNLSALLDGVGKQVEYSHQGMMIGTRVIGFDWQQELGYWTLDNQDAFFPRAYDLAGNGMYERPANDYLLMNVGHLRIKNISLSYDLPVSLVRKMKFRKISVNVSAENIGSIYNLNWVKDIPPDQVIHNSGSVYPFQSIYSIGLKLGI